tara:strand:- start:454 stop:648 length:195 start_codon:yes stop_codon:yes gene_type:complete
MERIKKRVRRVPGYISPAAIVGDGIETRTRDLRVSIGIVGFVKKSPSPKGSCCSLLAGANRDEC